MEAIFQRRDEEFTLEFRQDLATVDYLVISHLPNGTKTTDSFPDQTEALAYFNSLEAGLLKQSWHRVEQHRPRSAKHRQILRQDPDQAPSGETRSNGGEPQDIAPEATEGASGSGIYTLEQPLYCPHCRQRIQSIYVVRLTRAHVPFTSTLPRGGRAIACSECDGILTLELSGLL